MSNPFDPNTGGMISKKEAEEWIHNFDVENRPDKEKDTKSIFYGKEFLRKILETEGAAGISFFFAKNPDPETGEKRMNLILVPATEDGRLLWPSLVQGKDDPDPGAYDKGAACPPHCG